ncbi:hypothetical protein [Clostridium formicaceticum]|uniref:Uncharacterized protein n=1 Tax=Clostridium formicaceticum TaxID=1497 RepID=A0AAC9RQ41_9CLOT|nr:hypothetical protein [Clostridium formicaceticum]AOY74994.1 hypothetical protein BJL90_02865 [Clostridium formicaceticum]ARE89407.1 hypothetical protein CLFO_38140 [Clostridium formicaceticum]
MNQRSPLLQYRTKCNTNEGVEFENIKYDFSTGLWMDESGQPLIKKYITSTQYSNECQETLITRTREGIDRSEASSYNESNQFFVDKTLITESREGIDRAEISCQYSEEPKQNYSKILGQTLETCTREGIDRSERATDSQNTLFQTLTTFTRESIDRSEQS